MGQSPMKICESFMEALSRPLKRSRSFPVGFVTPGTTASLLRSLLRSTQIGFALSAGALDLLRLTFASAY